MPQKMGHSINALIGARQTLSDLIERFGTPWPTELGFGLVIVPLDEGRLDALAMSEQPVCEGFNYLQPATIEAIGKAAGSGAVLYIETDYFGGMGGQTAALISEGTLCWLDSESSFAERRPSSPFKALLSKLQAPSLQKSPINPGLAVLGVARSGTGDEFDSIGLSRFRSLEALGFNWDDMD